MNKLYTEAQLLKDNSVVRRNEALEVKPILLGRLFFFLHRNGNHFSHVKPVLNASFELRHAEEQGVLDCFLHCINTHNPTLTHTNVHTHRRRSPGALGACSLWR